MDRSQQIDFNRLRSYTAAFSRKCFTDILKYNDFNHINWIYQQYDYLYAPSVSYLDYFKKMYSSLTKYYRCEYVYKNEIIKALLPQLKKECGSKETVVYNEFRAGNSIADIAFFNGESKAFEIKTDLDSPRRLSKQILDYKLLFDRCYIVIPSDKYEQYRDLVQQDIGIVLLSPSKNSLVLEKVREAKLNDDIDVDVLIRCLHTEEYIELVSSFIGKLPTVPDYMMFDECKRVMRIIPKNQLRDFFLKALEHRRNNSKELMTAPKELRQICLSLGLDKRNIDLLISRLSEQIN